MAGRHNTGGDDVVKTFVGARFATQEGMCILCVLGEGWGIFDHGRASERFEERGLDAG